MADYAAKGLNLWLRRQPLVAGRCARNRADAPTSRRAIPHVYGDQQFQVSDWFCRSDWWYRTEMELPQDFRGKRVWLNFDGINHKADIFVNGHVAGKMSGAFLRGRFDVTDKCLVAGRKNCVAVLIHPMPIVLEPTVKRLDQIFWADCFTPNAPTFVESAEWDWLPTIRDRKHRHLEPRFPQSQRRSDHRRHFCHHRSAAAARHVAGRSDCKATLQNHSIGGRAAFCGERSATSQFRSRCDPVARETLRLPRQNGHAAPVLYVRNPKLWWPNGYGPQNLYDFSPRFEARRRRVGREDREDRHPFT